MPPFEKCKIVVAMMAFARFAVSKMIQLMLLLSLAAAHAVHAF
jgi:hypothetical protein